MPQSYKPKTDRKYQNHKVVAIPSQFKVGFIATLDKRTDLAKTLRANYEAIIADIGGESEKSHVKSALIERFCWLEAVLQTLEHDMADGKIDKGDVLGRWIQAVNSLAGLAKVLGIERKAKSMPWLESTRTLTKGVESD